MKTHLTANGFDMTSELDKYARGKIAHIMRLVPYKLRRDVVCTVDFSLVKRKGVKYNTSCIELLLGNSTFRAEETTQHMYAALDIAAVHVEHQLLDQLNRQRPQGVRQRLRHGLKADWPTPGAAR